MRLEFMEGSTGIGIRAGRAVRLALVASIGAVGLWALTAVPSLADGVTSRITGSNCTRAYNSFTVPNGRSATNFQIVQLQSGVKCSTRQSIDRQGFHIRSDTTYNNVFDFWSKNGQQTGGGNLGALVLGPGKYTLVVDGGDGAVAELRYSIK